MKNKRFIAFVICLIFCFNLCVPVSYASEFSEVSLQNVTSNNEISVYVSDTSLYKFVVFLDCSKGVGSFAIMYMNNPGYLYDYSFSFNADNYFIDSELFWEEVINRCFLCSDDWGCYYVADAIVTGSTTKNSAYLSLTDTFTGEFHSWLEQHYGQERSNRYVYSRPFGGIVFCMYETVDFSIVQSNTYLLLQSLSVAGVILSVVGAIVSPGLLATLGVFTSASGLIPAGTRLDEYTLSAYWNKYITVKDGTIMHSFTEMRAEYTAFASTQLDAWSVNEEDVFTYYNPTEVYFDDDNAQFTSAYSSYIS